MLFPSDTLYPSEELYPDTEVETSHGFPSYIMDMNKHILEDDDEIFEILAYTMRALHA